MNKRKRKRGCRCRCHDKNRVSLVASNKAGARQWFREVVLLGMSISFIPDLIVSGADNIYGYCPYYEQCAGIVLTGYVKVIVGLLFGLLTIFLVRLIINGKFKSSSVSGG